MCTDMCTHMKAHVYGMAYAIWRGSYSCAYVARDTVDAKVDSTP